MVFRDGTVLRSYVYAAPPRGIPVSSGLSLDTSVPGVVLRELVSADLDTYYDLVDRRCCVSDHSEQRNAYDGGLGRQIRS